MFEKHIIKIFIEKLIEFFIENKVDIPLSI